MIVTNKQVLTTPLIHSISSRRKKNEKTQQDEPAIRGALRFRLVKAIQQLSPLQEAVVTARDAIMVTFGGKLRNIDGVPGVQRWDFETDKGRMDATKEINELLELENEIEIDKIKLTEIEQFTELTADEIVALDWLLEF